MRSKTTAILLAWLFWPALDFYLGNPANAIAKLLTVGGLGIWALVDAILVTTMSDGQFDTRYNLQVLCSSCNRIEGDRPQEYLTARLAEVAGSGVLT